ncbi:MAG: Holliday junction resolvase RuvX [Clostridiales bacterium]|jgi:putative Holliday junction resolvase|nr:Holliday junction resolvase RuvX [Clostridiales bacterium]
MRILGVDYGDRRTGIAMSDPLGWTAQGLEAVVGDMCTAVDRVAELAALHQAQAVVVGYPLNMNGTAGARAERTDAFIAALKGRINGAEPPADTEGGPAAAAVIRWDERLTSVSAGRALREAGIHPTSRKEREKGRLDILSAVILLQSYLDSRSK